MRSYSFARMLVDGKEVSKLDIIRMHNTFHIYEHDINVFVGSWGKAVEFVENWKERKGDIVNYLKATNHEVAFEQTIG